MYYANSISIVVYRCAFTVFFLKIYCLYHISIGIFLYSKDHVIDVSHLMTSHKICFTKSNTKDLVVLSSKNLNEIYINLQPLKCYFFFF